MLEKLYVAHLGIVKTKQRARQILFWPRMNHDIEQIVSKCAVCNQYRKSNSKEPLIPHDIPSHPWLKVGADLFNYKGKEYLLCVDYYSKYPEIVLLQDLSSKTTVTALKSIFARHGIPQEVVTDNGPQSASATFRKFSHDWEFTHTTSSPRYPKSNGQAERCVQTVKNLLKKADESNGDIYIALLEYRASPIDGVNQSPAKMLMNRQVKTKLPSSILAQESLPSLKPQLQHRQKLQKIYHDRNQCVTASPVHSGEIVHVQNSVNRRWEPAVVHKRANTPRSYVVKTADGKYYRCNRKHINQTGETQFVQRNRDTDDVDIPEPNEPCAVETEIEPRPNIVNTRVHRGSTITRSGRVSSRPAYLNDYVQ
ncbi:uncharacterized protein K02A2.6-like [Ylistrum balloti]|uniref:uncharacterized protein K02A2.6-like n=1 Tax=Ylistrum balloti TaxID=509963 RepID=UPI002905A615|nr:uncharacterized protein K02A2.6-like [Ylistrum balloti]